METTNESLASRCEMAVASVKTLRSLLLFWFAEDIQRQQALEEVGGPRSTASLKERERHYISIWNEQLEFRRGLYGADAVEYALVVLDLTQVGK